MFVERVRFGSAGIEHGVHDLGHPDDVRDEFGDTVRESGRRTW
ncbi:hypothetical protein ACFWM1_15130 [Nocardia sp. NPDC058379]